MAIRRLKQSVYTRTMDCVEQRNGGWYVRGTRISLDSVVYSYLRGETPEQTVDDFSSLTLDQVKAAVAYYLANREAVDKYLAEQRAEFDREAEEAQRKNPALYEKLARAREEVLRKYR
jgi:uncharacterized protein (DUF433 family)